MTALHKAAEARGVELEEKAHGHWHLKGPLLVNYYPLSKKRSAYVAGTTIATQNVTPEAAVAMCFEQPKLAKRNKRRKGGYRKIKHRLFYNKGRTTCRWCHKPMTMVPGHDLSATLEHIVPLDSGGLDNPNNMDLACRKCNHERGNVMVELVDGQVEEAENTGAGHAAAPGEVDPGDDDCPF